MNVYQHIQHNKWKTALLMSGFIAVVLVLGWWFGEYYGGDPFTGIIIASAVALLMTTVSYFFGDSIALATAGAKEVTQEDSPYLWNMVETVAISAGMPMPRVFLIPDEGMNAFATGRTPETAAVAFTVGIVEGLENEELEGVIAHELSHIKNYDTRVMMIVAILVGVIALLSDMLLRAQLFGRGNSERSNQLQLVFLVIGIALVILSPIIAQLIKLAVSRKREYLADASGVLLTRYSEGLIGALRKLEQSGSGVQHANQATAHLYFANPFGGKRRLAARLFSTHPPIADRIQALEQMKGA